MRRSAAVLTGYVAVSFLYFGARILPHPGRELVGFGTDPQISVWAFAWWPHAILHGENPLVTHAIWAPEGLHLAWTTTVPALAVLFAPVTLLFGPVVAYNAAAVLLPALAAWTAFLLCRRVTRSFWPAVVGGYLFGFSAYMLGQELGHMHMTAVFLLPLVALVLLRFVDGELTRRQLAVRLGLLFAAQTWLSTELLFTTGTALVVALVLAYALVPRARPRVRELPAALGGGALLAAVLAAPLLVDAALHFESESINLPQDFSGDLLQFVVPTRLVQVAQDWAPSLSDRFPGGDAERGGYLGVPALAAAVWAGIRLRQRFLLAALALSAFASLGTALWVGGHRVGALPWGTLARVPPFTNVLPVRLSLFTALVAAVLVALALRTLPARAAVVVAALAVVALVPTLRLSMWSTTPQRVAFFSDGLYRRCLAPDDIVFVVPFGGAGSSMLWQAESDFGFALAGGYLRPKPPSSYLRYPAVATLQFEGVPPAPSQLQQLFAAKGVTRVVVTDENAPTWRPPLAFLGTDQEIGGVVVFPGCAS